MFKTLQPENRIIYTVKKTQISDEINKAIIIIL